MGNRGGPLHAHCLPLWRFSWGWKQSNGDAGFPVLSLQVPGTGSHTESLPACLGLQPEAVFPLTSLIPHHSAPSGHTVSECYGVALGTPQNCGGDTSGLVTPNISWGPAPRQGAGPGDAFFAVTGSCVRGPAVLTQKNISLNLSMLPVGAWMNLELGIPLMGREKRLHADFLHTWHGFLLIEIGVT